ncbi:hypothetical protein M0805_006776 [Coniferiporia weirii]|nr:hypothetical protein M0805_006776 [Coniferiporia weirii]
MSASPRSAAPSPPNYTLRTSATFAGRTQQTCFETSHTTNKTQTYDKGRSHAAHLSVQSEKSGLSVDTSTSLDTEYRGPIIPPEQDKMFSGRNLILCFDGTGDQFDLDNSNIIQFFSVLKKGDQNRQLVYYQSGIGTYTIPQVATPFYSRVAKVTDLMFANNLNHHVMSGYKFLMQNYREGDKICIFGFSRGAYTARALAGMVHKVGLLPAWNEQQVPFAYKMYKTDTKLGWQQSVGFKRTFSLDVDVEFVGVWDTVASVGLLPSTLPFTKSNTAIKVFRHALSLDEHRVKFRPSTYQHTTGEEASRGDFVPPPRRGLPSMVFRGRKRTKSVKVTQQVEEHKPTEGVKTSGSENNKNGVITTVVATAATKLIQVPDSRRSDSGSRSRAFLGSIERSARSVRNKVQDAAERVSSELEKNKDGDNDSSKEELSPDAEREQLEQKYLDRTRPTDVLEVWFAGCHCDVGGGSVPNDTPNSLARIPLRWMIRECFLARTGIQFEADRLRDIGLDPTTLYPRVVKRPEPTAETCAPPVPPKDSAPGSKAAADKGAERISLNSERALGHGEVEDGDVDSIPQDSKPECSKVSATPLVNRRRRKHISAEGTLVEDDVGPGEDGDKDGSEDALYVQVKSASEEFSVPASEKQNVLGDSAPSGVSTEQTLGVPPTTVGIEAEADARDALSPVYDQLKLAKWWWLLEILPVKERMRCAEGAWKKKWTANRGRPRSLPQEQPLKVHRSVKMRMEAKELGYTPRVCFDKEPIWVD